MRLVAFFFVPVTKTEMKRSLRAEPLLHLVISMQRQQHLCNLLLLKSVLLLSSFIPYCPVYAQLQAFQRPCKNRLWAKKLHIKVSQDSRLCSETCLGGVDDGFSQFTSPGSVSSEFTSGNCAKTLKKRAVRRQLALCEGEVRSISLAFGSLPTAGG